MVAREVSEAGRQRERGVIELLGVRVAALDTGGLQTRILEQLQRSGQSRVMYVNADCMLKATRNAKYRSILNRADIVYADGLGVVWAARFLGQEMPGRSTAADFMPCFAKAFGEEGYRAYLLGGKPGVAQKAAAFLANCSSLPIAGFHHGYFRWEESDEVIAEINAARADIVLVGFGAPAQELWIDQYGDRLNVSLVWGVGGLFDFLSGRTPRGPKWLWNNGFEWLCRLIVEPRRLWRRYIFGQIRFVLYVVRSRYSPGRYTGDCI
jgi:N-acetylglucosaminyldiphosphoundecaprenol N-acetyl-beta-D-mannosaminyltransferase